MRHPNGETVTRLRAGLISNPYSGEDTLAAWNDEAHPPTELQIPRCAVDDSKTRETLDVTGGAVVTDFVIWPDAQYDIRSSDRLVIRGLTCTVVGRPSTPHNPMTGDEPGMEIFANVLEGK